MKSLIKIAMNRFDERHLNGMGVFAAIVRSGSFAEAGRQLDMSQSGVSRSVARLETRLGIRLFDRTTRVVKLTDEGRRFYEQIAPLLAGLEEAAAMANGDRATVRGHLRVNVDPFFSRLILGPHLEAFLDRYPEIHVDLMTRDHLGDMVSDGFDLAVRFGEPRNSSLVARKLLDTRILTVAAPAYLRRHGRPSHPKDLEDRKHVCIEFLNPETGRAFVWEFHQKRKKIQIQTNGRLTLNDVGTMHSACLAGYGIAQVMEIGVEPMIASGKLVELFPDWGDDRFPLYALYPSRHHLPAKTRAFIDFIATLTTR